MNDQAPERRGLRAVLVLLALGGMVLAAVVGDVVLRIYPIPAIEIHRRAPASTGGVAFFSYDPALGWRGRPHARGPFSGWEFTSEVALNARGFRDRDVAEAKPAQTFRIVVLGDSITWGHGVGQREPYPALLEERLRRRGLSVEVLNLAVSGYGTDQESLLFQTEGHRYCPDVVLLGLYENDLRENGSGFQGTYPKPYFRLEGGRLVRENDPVPRIPGEKDFMGPAPPEAGLKAWLRRHVRLYAALAFLRQAVRERGAEPPRPAAASPAEVELTAALIRDLARAVERSGSRFAVIVLPDLHSSPAMASAVTRAGLAMWLDLTPVFRAAAGEGSPLFFRLDGAHWTRRAHALAAGAIADLVVRAQLLSGRPRACPSGQ